MSNNAYFEIYLHITWRTKEDACVLRGPVEKAVHEFLRQRVIESEDAWFDAIGGADDHIHLAVHVSPQLNIAEWIGRLKGACARHVNVHFSDSKLLKWQSGYGVVSFGKKNLPFVIKYINEQRTRHARNEIVDRLERALEM